MFLRPAVVALGVLLAPGRAKAQDAVPHVEVVGHGTAFGTPDVMIADLGVTVLRPTSQEAMRVASERAAAVLQALQRGSVDERDIQTQQLAVYPRYEDSGGAPKIVAYEATNLVRVRFRDLDSAGEALDRATSATEQVVVQGVTWELEDDDALLREAREQAWRDAMSRAEQLADLAGLELGPARAITEQHEGGRPIPYSREADVAASVPIQPGEVGVDVNLTVDFGLRRPGS